MVKKFNRKVRKGLRKERKVQEYGFMVKILTAQTLTIKLFNPLGEIIFYHIES